MTIRQTLTAAVPKLKKVFKAVAPKLKKVLAAIGKGVDAMWSQPAADATQPAKKGTSDQNTDSIWGTPADIENMWDSPHGGDTAVKPAPPAEPPGSAESAVVVELRVSTQQGGAGIPPALQAPLSTETPLGVTPQKKKVRGKEPTLEDILPVPDNW